MREGHRQAQDPAAAPIDTKLRITPGGDKKRCATGPRPLPDGVLPVERLTWHRLVYECLGPSVIKPCSVLRDMLPVIEFAAYPDGAGVRAGDEAMHAQTGAHRASISRGWATLVRLGLAHRTYNAVGPGRGRSGGKVAVWELTMRQEHVALLEATGYIVEWATRPKASRKYLQARKPATGDQETGRTMMRRVSGKEVASEGKEVAPCCDPSAGVTTAATTDAGDTSSHTSSGRESTPGKNTPERSPSPGPNDDHNHQDRDPVPPGAEDQAVTNAKRVIGAFVPMWFGVIDGEPADTASQALVSWVTWMMSRTGRHRYRLLGYAVYLLRALRHAPEEFGQLARLKLADEDEMGAAIEDGTTKRLLRDLRKKVRESPRLSKADQRIVEVLAEEAERWDGTYALTVADAIHQADTLMHTVTCRCGGHLVPGSGQVHHRPGCSVAPAVLALAGPAEGSGHASPSHPEEAAA